MEHKLNAISAAASGKEYVATNLPNLEGKRKVERYTNFNFGRLKR